MTLFVYEALFRLATSMPSPTNFKIALASPAPPSNALMPIGAILVLLARMVRLQHHEILNQIR